MNAHDALKLALRSSDGVWKMYLDDLSDAELLERPVDKANHIAWQLGHLITAENGLTSQVCPGVMPELPEGFAERHTSETAASDDPNSFLSKDEYLQLFQQQRTATLAALDGLTAEQLDEPAPEDLRHICQTVGGVFALQASHWTMHAGQWAVIRRKLGRPPLF